MHRTTTTATLLVTVAAAALSGCVTVQGPPAPGASGTPVRPPLPRPDGRTEPRIVQAPAREALDRGAPSSREAGPGDPAPRRPAAPDGAREREPDPSRQGPGPRAPHPAPPRPRTDPPSLPDPGDPGAETDPCALGEKYGGWRADSPAAAICQQAQGG